MSRASGIALPVDIVERHYATLQALEPEAMGSMAFDLLAGAGWKSRHSMGRWCAWEKNTTCVCRSITPFMRHSSPIPMARSGEYESLACFLSQNDLEDTSWGSVCLPNG